MQQVPCSCWVLSLSAARTSIRKRCGGRTRRHLTPLLYPARPLRCDNCRVAYPSRLRRPAAAAPTPFPVAHLASAAAFDGLISQRIGWQPLAAPLDQWVGVWDVGGTSASQARATRCRLIVLIPPFPPPVAKPYPSLLAPFFFCDDDWSRYHCTAGDGERQRTSELSLKTINRPRGQSLLSCVIALSSVGMGYLSLL